MKKTLACILLLTMLLLLSVGLFACEEEAPPSTLSEEALAKACVDAALPDEEDNAPTAISLLALLKDAGLEQAEIRSSLLALTEQGETIGLALSAWKARSFREEDFQSYRAALQTVANSVSPEVAGSVYYAIASEIFGELSYTKEDCRKIASLLLGQDDAFGEQISEIISGGFSAANERTLNTALYTLAASLKAAVGISGGAKDAIRTLLDAAINTYFANDEGLSQETQETLQKSKRILLSLSDIVISHYDTLLSYAADYLSEAGARSLLGLPYERSEYTQYFGYDYATWEATPISEEEYLARTGDYDEYLSQRSILKGFTVNGEFLPISEEDAALADRVYRLRTAVTVYDALSDEKKTEMREALDEFLSFLSDEQDLLAALLDKEQIEEVERDAVTLDEVLSALRALTFDATDGITQRERDAARSAITLYEGYLHTYLPKLY